MKIPPWVQQILTDFESRTESHNEVQISDALRRASNSHQDMSEADFKGYYAEWAAFLFRGRAKEDSIWGTYFSPMATMKRTDGTEFHSPDLAELNAEVVSHWEVRARSVKDPVMQARYADLVWDLKKVITRERQRPHELAQIAVAAYIDATKKRKYTMDLEAVWWLNRALGISLAY
jgi:lysyl-tRNA synthetase class 1